MIDRGHPLLVDRDHHLMVDLEVIIWEQVLLKDLLKCVVDMLLVSRLSIQIGKNQLGLGSKAHLEQIMLAAIQMKELNSIHNSTKVETIQEVNLSQLCIKEEQDERSYILYEVFN